jgi:hypothetical protein
VIVSLSDDVRLRYEDADGVAVGLGDRDTLADALATCERLPFPDNERSGEAERDTVGEADATGVDDIETEVRAEEEAEGDSEPERLADAVRETTDVSVID